VKRSKKYEQICINLSWIFIAMALCMEILYDFLYIDNVQFHQKSVYRLVLIFALVLLNLLKQLAINKDLFANNILYWGVRALEIITITFSLRFLGFGQLIYPFMFVIILLTAWGKPKKDAFFATVFITVNDVVFSLIYFYFYQKLQLSIIGQDKLLINAIIYFLMFMFSMISGSISADEMEKEKKNRELYSELENNLRQLETERNENKLQVEKLKETNYKVEEANKKLRESIAEYYTVQQITQAISSIFDVKELLKHVNDIILGVMGVNNSTIVLYDEKKDRLRVHTTNVSNKSELIALFDNINCDVLKDVLKSKKPLLENFVDSGEYPFTEERDVNSLICVPLVTKTKNFGLVLVEHKYFNAFDEDNLRLLNIIGQQVSIALENAELYEKMHEMATVDNLTGVYNRLYFQDRLQKEFENAQKEGYSLSLAIFDIDHFKRFNDTFGHLFGDKVLKDISNLLKSSLRSGDIIARFGGEEFVVLFPRTGLKEAYDKVEGLREKIAKTVIRDDLVTASVTVSFGLSAYPEISSTQSELLRMADNALYAAKASGRNCVKIANADMAGIVDLKT